MSGNRICLATIGAPHGVKGELRVKSHTGDPLAFGDYGPLTDAAGRQIEVLDVRPSKTVVVARFKGITTREQAEALNGVDLYIDRDMLPDEELEEDEFFHEDLIGLAVKDPDGATLGKVTALHDFGGGDLLEITFGGRRGIMVPFTRAAVPVIDIEGGFVTVEPVAAGLVATDDDEDDGRPGGERPEPDA
ncbi:MAG: ribosome maturation factor RimM [Notoacmeibacter sp.]|nr:ribosome maturation factor RimM [Notoacmeibacter sp.]MCC0033282.1 ribosome maturation factor RimM [Brucellaceae bacterium]